MRKENEKENRKKMKESEILELKKSTSELKEAVVSIAAILNKLRIYVGEKHKVYAAIIQNLSSISLGDKTFDGNSFLNTLSPENIGQSNLRERARYCTSFKCVESNFSASGRNSENSDLGMNVICSITNSRTSSNSSFDSLVLLENSSLCFSNSVNKNSGARNSNLLNKLFIEKMLNESPLPNNDERTTLTSTTTSIFYRYLFDKDSLILSDSSSTSFSLNFDLLTILCNRTILSSLDFITLLTNIDQSIFGTCPTNFNSSGILIHISSMVLGNESQYKKLSVADFSLKKITDVYKDINENSKDVYFRIIFNRPVTPQATPQVEITELEKKIITEIEKNPKISRNELAKILGISPYTIKEYLRKLREKNILKRIGETSAGYWEVLKKVKNKKFGKVRQSSAKWRKRFVK